MENLDIALQFSRLSALILSSPVNCFFLVGIRGSLLRFHFHNTSSANFLPVVLFAPVFCLVNSFLCCLMMQIYFKFLESCKKNFCKLLTYLSTICKNVHSQKFLSIHKEVGNFFENNLQSLKSLLSLNHQTKQKLKKQNYGN